MSHYHTVTGITIGLALLCAGCQGTEIAEDETSGTIAHASTVDRVDRTNSPPTNSIDCSNPQTSIEMNDCAAHKYDRADARLNRTYDELIARLDKTNREKLIDSQLTWLQFRDANCEWEASDYNGDPLQTSVRLGCLERLTQQRNQDLENADEVRGR
ncbi:MAG: DUF1311 domain-containing protein [Cyanobacteria bacterium SID2]|nr:DUF1311 domain-containing protein [Cyanobacteria bacterium SID2]MBP0006547.1 DUF1311 domain-containing protein [Cyanobacteria bacterium SBC]